MPFRDAFTAQTSTFDYGCGLHCLANAYVLNLKERRFTPEEEQRSLEELLKGFKEYYAGARDLTAPDLKRILVDLQNPVHREVILSRVLRNMIQPANSPYRVPGAQVPDREVQRLANRLRMRAESYGSLKALVEETHPMLMSNIKRILSARNWPYNEENILKIRIEWAEEDERIRNRHIKGFKITPEFRSRTEEEIRKRGITPTLENIVPEVLAFHGVGGDYETQNALPNDDQGDPPLPANAPLLKLMNKQGGHWEWEYNLHPEDAKNLAEVREHNRHYANHPVKYGATNDYITDASGNVTRPSNVAIQLRDGFNQALLNRQAIWARNQRLSDELNAFEAEMALRAGRRANPNPSPNVGASSLPSGLPNAGIAAGAFPWHSLGANAEHPTGFMGLFSNLFNLLSPLYSAPQGTQAEGASNIGKTFSVFQNILGTLQNFFKPSAPGEGGFGAIMSRIFGWLGQLVGIVGKGAEMLESAEQADPNRPLKANELNTPEDELFAQHLNYLPTEASAIKTKLLTDFRNLAKTNPKPKDGMQKLLSELKDALEQYALIPECRNLIFNQHLLKIEQPAQDQLRLHYQRSGGSPLVWKNLSDHLAKRNLLNEASEVLLQEENRVLNQAFSPIFKASKGFSKAEAAKANAELKAAGDHYQATLRSLLSEPPTVAQHALRRDMLAVIESNGQEGIKIREGLSKLFREYREGSKRAPEDLKDRMESVHHHWGSESGTERMPDRDRDFAFTTPPGFMPGFAADAARSEESSREHSPFAGNKKKDKVVYGKAANGESIRFDIMS